MKKVTMGPKPTSAPASADAWVAGPQNSDDATDPEAPSQGGVGHSLAPTASGATTSASGAVEPSREETSSSGMGTPVQRAPSDQEAPATPATLINTPMKRLTIDISEELHARIKSQCAMRRTKMVDEIRTLLETHFAADA